MDSAVEVEVSAGARREGGGGLSIDKKIGGAAEGRGHIHRLSNTTFGSGCD
jgi:hypothetical protein